MSRETFTNILHRVFQSNKDTLSFRLANAHPLEPNTIHVPEELFAAAFEEPEIASLDGLIFNQGNFAATFRVRSLLEALIASCQRNGIEHSLAAMYEFINSDVNRRLDVVILEGVCVREITEIVDGIFIAPQRSVPSSTLQAYLTFLARPSPQTPFSMLHILDGEKRPEGAALYTVCEVSPRFYAKMPSLSIPAEPDPIYQIANILTIAGPSSPVASKTYSELADGEFLKGRAGFGWGRTQSETRVTKETELSPDTLRKIKSTIRKYLALRPEVKKKLAVPLHRLNEAIKHQNAVDRALDLGIALEALLLAHQPSKEQLSLQFRLRGAWLLGENGQQRTALYEVFNKLYAYRSFAAHSGAVAPTKTPEEEVKKTLSDGLTLCADAIRKIVDMSGFPAWDRLIVGADYVLDEHEYPNE